MIDDRDFLPLPGETDNAPPPNPHFVRTLKGELMVQATRIALSNQNGARPMISTRNPVSRTPVNRPFKRHWDRGLTLQSVVVAILLVALLGSIFSGYREGGITGNNGALIPAPQTEEPHIATYRENAARTGVSAEQGPRTVPAIGWTQPIGAQLIQNLLYSEGVIYLATENYDGPNQTSIQARDAKSGEVLWESEIGWISEPSLLIAGETVYVSSSGDAGGDGDDGFLTAFDALTGAERWKSETSGTSNSSPVLADGVIYIAAKDHSFRAIDATTGEDLWQLDVEKMSADAVGGTPFPAKYSGLQTEFSPAIAHGKAFITAGDGVLYAIDLATRSLVWYFESQGNMLSTPAIVDNSLYLRACNWLNPDETESPDSETCWIYKIDDSSGIVSDQVEGFFSLFAATTDQIVVFQDDHTALLSTETLQPTAVFPAELYDPVVSDDVIYLSDASGTLFAYQFGKPQDDIKLLWSAFTGRSIGSPVLLAKNMLITFGPSNSDNSRSLISLSAAADATPTAGTTTVDLSGMAPCTPPPPIDWANLTGEPANTITDQVGMITATGPVSVDPPTAEEKRAGYSSGMEPWMDFDAIPDGAAAPEAIRTEIQTTINQIVDCLNRNSREDYSGFFSEDFLRRDYVQFVLNDLGYSTDWFAGVIFPNFLQESTDYRVLDDGRVAILADPANPQFVDNFAIFVVFVERDGHWVVDEIIRVGLGALQG